MRGSWFLLALACTTSFAVPATAAECGPLQLVTSLPLTPLSPGNVVTVPVAIGDRPMQFLVDTGGVTSMVTRRTVREMNLSPIKVDGRLIGISGAYSDEMVRVPSFTVGKLRQEGGYLAIEPAKEDPNDTRPAAFGGVLGPDMLQKFDADFDFGGKKLNLISQNHCEGKVVYWPATATAVVPFAHDAAGHLTFPMTLDGRRVRAMLDTGATRTNLNLNVARGTFGIDTSAPDVEKVGELKGGYTADVYQKRFKELAADGVIVTNPMITLLPDMIKTTSEPRPTGSLIRDVNAELPELILGMSVLSKLHVYIANKEHKLYITAANPASSTGAPEK